MLIDTNYQGHELLVEYESDGIQAIYAVRGDRTREIRVSTKVFNALDEQCYPTFEAAWEREVIGELGYHKGTRFIDRARAQR